MLSPPSRVPRDTDSSGQSILFSIVVPVYKNQADVPHLLTRLKSLSRQLPELEAVIVVDGSPDRSHALLSEGLRTLQIDAQLIRHSRNFGSFAAIRTGLSAARGRVVVCMAADLQEPEDLIVSLAQVVANEEGCDIALGTREGRDDPVVSRWFSSVFWRLHKNLVQSDIPAGGVDVFACTRQVATELLKLPEANSSLIGQLFWLGFRRREVLYRRNARERGVSSWSWQRKFSYAMDSIFAFTSLPIVFLLAVGGLGAVVTSGLGVTLGLLRLSGRVDVAGYTAVMLAILFSTSILLVGLGIVGSYVWRTYENSKQRPLAVVDSVQGFSGALPM